MKGSYPTFHSQPDYSEQDPEQIFITMLYVLKNLLNEHIHPIKSKWPVFVSVLQCIVCWQSTRAEFPLGNAVIWADNRAKKEAQKLKNSPASKIIYTATGTPMHPMSPLFKIAWFKNNDKERFKQASKFIQLKTYIIQQLTGEYLIDYSLGICYRVY
jgi:gluconokinase